MKGVELQALAARGYCVCYCNPAGSDSYGNEFGDLRGRFGQEDYRQILNFIGEVGRKYAYADTGRLGIWGGSYGGYLVNWTLGHTDIFRAAVSERSVANWITLETLSDIGAFYVPDQAGGSLLQHQAEQLWDNSPLKYADRIQTPTLFIQSECDYRCRRRNPADVPYAEAQEV